MTTPEEEEIFRLKAENSKRQCIIVQLRDEIDVLRDALETALPTIKRPSHDHPTCHCAPCGVMRKVRAALQA